MLKAVMIGPCLLGLLAAAQRQAEAGQRVTS